MLGRAELVVDAANPSRLVSALQPEMEDDLHRGSVGLISGEMHIKLLIESDDVASLRAALNTWIRLIKIGLEIEDL